MNIEEVITQTIIAIYSASSPSKALFLKGGSAMRLFDNLTSRLSIDADFSVHTDIDDESKFFRELKSSVGARFRREKFDIIDFEWNRKPKNIRAEISQPGGVDGYVSSNLFPFNIEASCIESKRRNALIPDGSNSSKVIVEISKHEYCGKEKNQNYSGRKDLRVFSRVACSGEDSCHLSATP